MLRHTPLRPLIFSVSPSQRILLCSDNRLGNYMYRNGPSICERCVLADKEPKDKSEDLLRVRLLPIHTNADPYNGTDYQAN